MTTTDQNEFSQNGSLDIFSFMQIVISIMF